MPLKELFEKDWQELEEFLFREFHSKATNMLETEKVLRLAGINQLGAQMGLGI